VWAEAVRWPGALAGSQLPKGVPLTDHAVSGGMSVPPAGGFSIPDPRTSPHGFVEPDQASGGHGCAVPRPDGDRDCGVQPIGDDEVGQLTDCHGGLLGHCPVHLRGASAGGKLGVALRLPPVAAGLDVTASFE
jgi:hypothetical protein